MVHNQENWQRALGGGGEGNENEVCCVCVCGHTHIHIAQSYAFLETHRFSRSLRGKADATAISSSDQNNDTRQTTQLTENKQKVSGERMRSGEGGGTCMRE